MNFNDLMLDVGVHIRLSDAFRLEESGGELFICRDGAKIKISREFMILKPYLAQMSEASVSFLDITDSISKSLSFEGLAFFYSLINSMDKNGFIIYSIPNVVEIESLSGYVSKVAEFSNRKAEYKLSRFAFMREHEGEIRLETSINPVVAKIYDSRLISALFSIDGIKMDTSDFQGALKLLYMFLFITDEAESDSLKQWDFHDLLMHGRSRFGRHVNGYGATYRFLGSIPCVEHIKKPPADARIITLTPPDIERIKTDSSPFFSVVEKRYSARSFNSIPITIKQLGDLLYLTSRVKTILPEPYYDVTIRPYPCGGRLYELEIYISSVNCDGLEKGLYLYNPIEHSLCAVSPMNAEVWKIVRSAQSASKCSDLQVVLTISARFQRVSWKYESIAYSLILKNTGVLLQNISLAATALNIGSCILGAGDSDILSRILGKSFYEESAVGELILGTI